MNKILSFFFIALFFLALLLIRAFEKNLFYDPLLNYFLGDYKSLPIPEMDNLKLYLHVFYRFLLNSAVSLGILWFVFKNKEVLKLSAILYAVVFIILFSVFVIIISTANSETSPWGLFYVRRFLIHPVLLLLLLPAFYFQKKKIS